MKSSLKIERRLRNLQNEFKNSGFFTLIKENNSEDTRQDMLSKLEKHFNI